MNIKMMEKQKDMGVKGRRPLSSINKNKIRKKRRVAIDIRNLIPKILEYLKSDSYMYSHLVSSSVPLDSPASHNAFVSTRGKTHLGKKGDVKEKLIEYLKSDTYLYAPLEGTHHHDDKVLKSAISSPRGRDLQFTRVSGTVLSENITWQTKKVAEESVNGKPKGYRSSIGVDANSESPQTPGLKEIKKHAVRRSNRLSTISG